MARKALENSQQYSRLKSMYIIYFMGITIVVFQKVGLIMFVTVYL